MHQKSDTFNFFVKFLDKAEVSTGNKLISVVSDNSGEFVNVLLNLLYESQGIQHLMSAP
jgi:hypothetical protein